MEEISKNFSFYGFKIWEWAKGRKRTIITAVAAGLGYFIMDQNIIGLIAGPIFEAVWAIVEFYFSKVKLKS